MAMRTVIGEYLKGVIIVRGCTTVRAEVSLVAASILLQTSGSSCPLEKIGFGGYYHYSSHGLEFRTPKEWKRLHPTVRPLCMLHDQQQLQACN